MTLPPTDDLDDYRHMLAWTKALPANADVRWWEDGCAVAGIHGRWIDVQVDGLHGFNWAWTVVSPDDEAAQESGDATCVVVPHDRIVHQVWDRNEHWYKDESFVVCNPDEVPTDLELAPLAKLAATDPDRYSMASWSGWSNEIVEAALIGWATTHADRADLRFHYEQGPLSLMHQEALAIADAVKSGIEPTYQIAEHVMVTGQVMDILLGEMLDDESTLD
jgi:hypothetical protein